jgi:hypothetical protein
MLAFAGHRLEALDRLILGLTDPFLESRVIPACEAIETSVARLAAID